MTLDRREGGSGEWGAGRRVEGSEERGRREKGGEEEEGGGGRREERKSACTLQSF